MHIHLFAYMDAHMDAYRHIDIDIFIHYLHNIANTVRHLCLQNNIYIYIYPKTNVILV